MDQNRLCQLALHFIPGIGNFLVRQLISYCGSAENVFKANKSRLLKVPGIGEVAANSILNQKPIQKAEEEFKRAEEEGVTILLYTDEQYPYRLKQIYDAPAVLFIKGNAQLNAAKIVAVVGTRKATEYGRSITKDLVTGLTEHNALIISGLAYGIDIQAHKTALKCGLPTLGVMAGGINKIYPASHRSTAYEMQDNGGIITEQSFDTTPEPPKFPARNRIIAGMADAIVVIEAASKGGALITAEMGNEYNRDVFAVPGEVGQTYSVGCNNLIKKNKAHLLTGISDLEYIMNWDKGSAVEQAPQPDLTSLNQDEKMVLQELDKYKKGTQIDKLSWSTQIPINKLASVLLTLEFQGWVKSLPGKNYKLTR
ncbi:DNA-protecting protein DprA [Fulvivirga sp. M361]|uniref:DNA-processing protein DprA n=1 Tax=Fulvivirga sp. M361 TaxID=2594266 RepID=UPI00117B9F0A|nr:DNA-processing protein DprA [Fulvivirga sp. M361]TRX52447.1 DNA-protecting protein DprA [Fulvivirga sp. M361]